MDRTISKNFTANYANTNNNFRIQNLPNRSMAGAEGLPFKLLLNILQRGVPTRLSPYLQQELGPIHERPDFDDKLPLIRDELPTWRSRIKGHDPTGQYPAENFFNTILPEALGKDRFVVSLILPEARINDILQVDESPFNEEQVDFYLPQARLVIEIDGAQHASQRSKDHARDTYLSKHHVETVRLSTSSLRARNTEFDEAMERIVGAVTKSEIIGFYRRQVFQSPLPSDYLQKLIPTSVIRYQVLLLELLLSGSISLSDREWNIELVCDEGTSPVALAANDLFRWLAAIHALLGNPRTSWPRISILAPGLNSGRSPDIRIDFSVTRRWTDEHRSLPNTIFVRTDYLDLYPILGGTMLPVDYFSQEAGAPIDYALGEGGREQLRRLTEYLFAHKSFQPGQLSIIENTLARRKTIGVLPTGGGKSLCYQLAGLLQPGASIVVSPIKSLMWDQVQELNAMGISRVAALTGDCTAEEKAAILRRFSRGQLLFLLVAPERFQIPDFRDAVLALQAMAPIAHCVVDEVHCMSEWGHDFRVSYLNLANTIRRLSPTALFLGLTATASVNVLKDIQIEFDVDQDDVCYRLDFERPELNFTVVSDRQNKLDCVCDLLGRRWGQRGIDSGIVFTPYVNGPFGCFPLSQKLANRLGVDVGFFSGSRPKKLEGDKNDFEALKQKNQGAFKNGHLSLIVATKAFGMGINKKDVRFTAHYGVPSSMESLYQEAGRAGRDGAPADCYVLASGGGDVATWLFDQSISAGGLKEKMEAKRENSDLARQAYLLVKGLEEVENETGLILDVLSILVSRGSGHELQASEFMFEGKPAGANRVQRALHRLCQLGYVSDWTVLDFFNGIYLVELSGISDESAMSNLTRLIQTYEPDKSSQEILRDTGFASVNQTERNPREFQERLITTLLEWAYDHFVYSRRQSLKNVHELCARYGELDSDGFRKELESFFRIDATSNRLRYVAEGGVDSIAEWRGLLLLDDGSGLRKISNIETLRSQLSRFLESYESNVGFNLLSGLIRLILDQYADPDGRARLIGALERVVQSGEPDHADVILDFVLDVGTHLDESKKRVLDEDLVDVLSNDRGKLFRIHAALDGEASAVAYLAQLASQIASTTERIIDGPT